MEVNLTETQRVAVKKHCGRIWEKDCNGKQYARIYPYDSFVRTVCADVLAKMDKRSERLVMALTSKDTFFNMVTGKWNFKTSDSAYCRSFADDAKVAMKNAFDNLLAGKEWKPVVEKPVEPVKAVVEKPSEPVEIEMEIPTEPKEKHTWEDYKPSLAVAYERWQDAFWEYRRAVNASYETEEIVFVEEPRIKKPVLDDEARAWLYIDGLCESDSSFKFVPGLRAKDAVLHGSMSLVDAAQKAETEIKQYINDHILD